MMRRMCWGWAAILLAFLVTRPARADLVYQYDFHFNASGDLAAADISAQSPTFLRNFGDAATIIPPGDVNGFMPVKIGVGGTEGGYSVELVSEGSKNTSIQVGQVVGFQFGGYTEYDQLGTYQESRFASRSVDNGFGYYTVFGSGTLTIFLAPSALPTPEPSTIALVATGLPALVWLGIRRRRRRQALQAVHRVAG